jgi:hypothetical protein
VAKECIRSGNEGIYIQAFERLVKDDDFSLDDMEDFVRRETRRRSPSLFRAFCEDFAASLRGYATLRKNRVENEVYRVLKEIEQLIESFKSA